MIYCSPLIRLIHGDTCIQRVWCSPWFKGKSTPNANWAQIKKTNKKLAFSCLHTMEDELMAGSSKGHACLCMANLAQAQHSHCTPYRHTVKTMLWLMGLGTSILTLPCISNSLDVKRITTWGTVLWICHQKDKTTMPVYDQAYWCIQGKKWIMWHTLYVMDLYSLSWERKVWRDLDTLDWTCDTS